jgi:hypothetical protein
MISPLNVSMRRLAILVLTAALLLSVPSFAHARAARKAAQATLANDSAEAGQLRQAYAILSTADHDYKGHRAAAMKQIEAAARRLGVELKGDGRSHEAQQTSDQALRAALGILSDITGAVKGQGLVHIQAAIKQLNTALAIK